MLNVAQENKAGMSGWPESRDQLSSSCFTILAAASLLMCCGDQSRGKEVQSFARNKSTATSLRPCESYNLETNYRIVVRIVIIRLGRMTQELMI